MRWFHNFKIGLKLGICFLVTVILLCLVGLMGVLGTSKINNNLDQVLLRDLPAIDYLLEADRDLHQLLVAERSLIFADAKSDAFKGFVSFYEENLKQSQDRLAKFESIPMTAEERSLFEEYKKSRKVWEVLSRKVVKTRQDDTPEGRQVAADSSTGETKAAFDKMRGYLDQIQGSKLKYIEKFQEDSKNIYRRTVLYVVSLTVVAMLVVILFLGLLNRSITRPVKSLAARGNELAEGEADLTKRLEIVTKDELGLLASVFDKFLARIEGIIIKVKESTAGMLKSTEEISTNSQELAGRTNEQAASITQTSTTLEEFASIMKLNSEYSEEANARLTKFDKEVKNKRELIHNVTETMSEIDRSSKEIGKIMNVINDISFQTNLLALNAAVEAARAGEAGRGFAVVASEVRNLAQKTADSSKTIQGIVTANVDSTQRGMDLVKETEEFFETIMKMLSELSVIIHNIENGSREQSTGIEQISMAVAQLDQVIARNAELVGNFVDAGKQMNTNSSQLKQLVDQFVTSSIDRSKSKVTGASKEPLKKKTKNVSTSQPRAKAPEMQEKKNPQAKPSGTAEDFFSPNEDGFEEF
jgi:methyl-accepting chemotaxis protein